MEKIILYQFPAPKMVPNFSPFCMKLETYLRMADIPYEIKATMNTHLAVTKKLPMIEINQQKMVDSGLIIDYFENQITQPLDQHLDNTERAFALAWRRLLEEHLYFIVVWSRWIDPIGWKYVRKLYFQSIPKPLRWLSHIIQRKVRNQLYQQGIGRHPKDTIYQMGINDIEASATLLNNKTYTCGDKICSLDACLFAFLGSILSATWDFPLKTELLKNDNLLAFYTRIANAYFPEYPPNVVLTGIQSKVMA